VNDNGNIIETINSNIFVVKNGTLYTSPITDGCIDGVMRKQILDIATQHKLLAFEQPLTVHTLTNGDEVFLTNAIKGILWVRQFENQPYDHEIAKQLLNNLNELIE
jgi:branched-chain amino acid aminotransferase